MRTVMNVMITTNELAEILQIPNKVAAEVIKAVNDDLKKEGAFVLNTRPMRAPTELVFKKLHIKMPNGS